MPNSNHSNDEDLGYFADFHEKEEELRKLNDELDLKLKIQNDSVGRTQLAINETVPMLFSNMEDSSIEGFPIKNAETEIQETIVLKGQNKKNIRRTVTNKNQIKKRIKNSLKDDSPRSVLPSPIKTPSESIFPSCITTETPRRNSSEEADKAPSIGFKATLRLRDARIKSLESQLHVALKEKQEMEENLKDVKQKYKSESSEKSKGTKKLTDQKNAYNKLKQEFSTSKANAQEWKDECYNLQRELNSTQKSLKMRENDQQAREVRLSRALQECESYKKSLAKATSDTREGGVETRKEKDTLIKNIKTLERQKSEILLAFKKQIKLIDILKRQKIHAEASRLVAFQEEEFMKVLDWGKEKV